MTRYAPSNSDISGFEFDEYDNLLISSGSGTASPKTWIGGLSVSDGRADSGMFKMGHRNYSAGVLGRFISRDPIGHRGSSLNLYSYPVNPVNFADFTGLDKILIIIGTRGKARQTYDTGPNTYRNIAANIADDYPASDEVCTFNKEAKDVTVPQIMKFLHSHWGDDIRKIYFIGHGSPGAFYPSFQPGRNTNVTGAEIDRIFPGPDRINPKEGIALCTPAMEGRDQRADSHWPRS